MQRERIPSDSIDPKEKSRLALIVENTTNVSRLAILGAVVSGLNVYSQLQIPGGNERMQREFDPAFSALLGFTIIAAITKVAAIAERANERQK